MSPDAVAKRSKDNFQKQTAAATAAPDLHPSPPSRIPALSAEILPTSAHRQCPAVLPFPGKPESQNDLPIKPPSDAWVTLPWATFLSPRASQKGAGTWQGVDSSESDKSSVAQAKPQKTSIRSSLGSLIHNSQSTKKASL